jgi:hypothetical protein
VQLVVGPFSPATERYRVRDGPDMCPTQIVSPARQSRLDPTVNFSLVGGAKARCTDIGFPSASASQLW